MRNLTAAWDRRNEALRLHSPEQRREMAALYTAGASVLSLRKRFGGSHSAARGAIILGGGTIRARGKRFGDADMEIARKMIAEGASCTQIAAVVGCPANTVFYATRRAGLKVAPRRGPLSGTWTGGVHRHGGYTYTWVAADDPMESMRSNNGYVPTHRLVMARLLGRPLTRSETVHHIDGDSLNNDSGNLQLRRGRHGKHAAFCCARCGSTDIRAVPIASKG